MMMVLLQIVLDKNKDGRVGLSEFGMLIRAFNKALSKGMPPMQVVQVCKVPLHTTVLLFFLFNLFLSFVFF